MIATIKAKSTKTMATRILRSRLSYFKCIKCDNTINDFTQAINNATANVKAPSCTLAILMVTKVKKSSINNVLDSDWYSMVWVVLFAMFL